MSEFDKIIDDLNKLNIKLNKFNKDVLIVKLNEKKKILNYTNLSKKINDDVYINKKNIQTNNKKFKKLFSWS